MKYLREFETQADYEAAVAEGLAKPNVSLVNEPFGVQYKKYVPLGVFIQHVDGSLYTEEQWTEGGFSNNLATGVAVSTEEAGFVVSKKEVGTQTSWRIPSSELVEGVVTASYLEDAKRDFAGQSNTLAMRNGATGGLIFLLDEQTFPNNIVGYIPSAGECWIAWQNKEQINALMKIIGGAGFPSYLWTSTQMNASEAWKMSNGTLSRTYKTANSTTRFFFPLNL